MSWIGLPDGLAAHANLSPDLARALLCPLAMTQPTSQLRITRSDAGARLTTLSLEGRLAEREWTALCAAREACGDRLVVLELSGLRFLGREVARRLDAWRREGIGLCGGSGFIRELLRLEELAPVETRAASEADRMGGTR
jgi:hypothetical protein